MRVGSMLFILVVSPWAALACSNSPPYCEPGVFMPTYGGTHYCVVLEDTMPERRGDAGADGDSGG